MSKGGASELAGEALVQQGLLQRRQRGELALVEVGEALDFGQCRQSVYPVGVVIPPETQP